MNKTRTRERPTVKFFQARDGMSHQLLARRSGDRRYLMVRR